ncbi:MAG: MbcA/ParS/Xre antitoxin family protein [Candidatus Paceibacterota bacterium]|jgi:hypothetical protein
MIQAIRKGFEIFGDKESFRLWLSEPNFAMGGKAPLEYDWNFIYEELIRIEFGALA